AGLAVHAIEERPRRRAGGRVAEQAPEHHIRVPIDAVDRAVRQVQEPRVYGRAGRIHRALQVRLVPDLPRRDRERLLFVVVLPERLPPELPLGAVPLPRGLQEAPPSTPCSLRVERRGDRGWHETLIESPY